MKTRPVIVVLFIVVAILMIKRFVVDLRIQENPLPLTAYHGLTLIAHAGGGLEHGMYSNSRQAITQSATLGFTLIELDFSNTENGELVLLHDWDRRYRQYFGFARPGTSANEFMSLNMKHGLTQLTLKDLPALLLEFPNIRIVTDIKKNNIENLRTISTLYPNLIPRFIPQIYELENFYTVQELGFRDIIYTNYTARRPHGDIINFASSHPLFALTMPYEAVTPDILTAAARIDLPVFVHKFLRATPLHELNSVAGADAIKASGIAGIYTDYLYPTGEK